MSIYCEVICVVCFGDCPHIVSYRYRCGLDYRCLVTGTFYLATVIVTIWHQVNHMKVLFDL